MINTERSQRLSDPKNNDVIMRVWERIVHGGPCESDALRRLVTDSWQRCLHAQIDPFQPATPPALDSGSFLKLRERHAELLNSCRPVMQQAEDVLDQTGTVMILTDPQGVILSVEGDSCTQRAAENISLTSGQNWNELLSGTNAIGTALATGMPVQIHSAEHFCTQVKTWTCAAAVIRNPLDGRILGAIDISGLQETYTPNSLALVVNTASHIENLLCKQELYFRNQLLELGLDRFSRTQDGIIIVDRHGRPFQLNQHARDMLRDQGIGADLNLMSPIAALNIRMPEPDGNPPMPDWLDPDCVETVQADGSKIGSILTLPRSSSRLQYVQSCRKPPARTSQDGLSGPDPFHRIIGNAPPLRDAIDKARRLAITNVSVLLLGETGVGKENMVRAMHQFAENASAAASKADAAKSVLRPFVAINCGAMSADLLASELFGYVDGAFTGARKGGMIGKAEAAHGGTLFLDEIGEMPLALQPHLLRLLEEGEIYRIGETRPRKVQFKLIAATHRNLQREVAEGRFREDLYYRISVTNILLPALRDIAEDIPLLARHLLQRLSAQYGMEAKTISDDAMALLCQYRWPGNIRELRNTIESMYLTSPSCVLHVKDLPAHMQAVPPGNGLMATPTATTTLGKLKANESQVIQHMLQSCSGNLTLVARELGIAKSTLYAKLNKLGLIDQLQKTRQDRHTH
ncbi:MAG: sigma-54-dependent Fis family transcriptional regulator [Advenella sp.]